MTAPSIRREITRDTKDGAIRYVNSWCRACTYWNAFAFTIEQSFDQGERHLMNVHDITAEAASRPRRQHEYRATNRENGSQDA